MAYTEIKGKKRKRYYYRVKSIRLGAKVKKKRVYLGVNLTKDELSRKEKEADKELMLLNSLLNEKKIKELEEIKKQYLKEPKENFENRYEAFCSLFTYNSTAIEGNTLTLRETSLLLFEKQTPRRSLREINEVLNHKEAFDFILKTKEGISKKLILKLHELVVKNTLKLELEEQTGKYRTMQVYIRGLKWNPPKPKYVSKEMGCLLTWYSKNKNKLHPLILTAYFHSAFEMIHPFIDGNGRVGRLLINLILHRNNYPMINIPSSKKYLYYKVLQEAQFKGNLGLFLEFLIKLLRVEKIRI